MKTLLAVFDTETTGLSTLHEHIVQLACVAYFPDDHSSVVEFNELAHPGKPIPADVTQIHGISDLDVQGQSSSEEVARAWWEALQAHAAEQGAQLMLAGHNILSYDIPMVRKYFPQPETWPGVPVLDSLRVARVLFPQAPKHKLGFLVGEYHQLDAQLAKRAHDGIADCYMVAKLLDYYMSASGKDLWALQEVSGQPRPLLKMPFGKHKGVAFSEIPRDYLRWVLDQPTMSIDVREAARRVLGA